MLVYHHGHTIYLTIEEAALLVDWLPLAVAARPADGGLAAYLAVHVWGNWTGFEHGWNRVFDRRESRWAMLDDYYSGDWKAGLPGAKSLTRLRPVAAATTEGLFVIDNDMQEGALLHHYPPGGEPTYEVLSSETLFGGEAAIAVDGGDLAIAWAALDSELRFSRRPAGGPLGASAVIAENVTPAVGAAICDDHLARVAYGDGGQVRVGVEGDPFVWETVDDQHTPDGLTGLTCEAGGWLHVVYDTDEGLYHADNGADGWSLELVDADLRLEGAAPDADGRPYLAVSHADESEVGLLHLTGSGWEYETLATAPYLPRMGIWSSGDDLVACYVPHRYVECVSTQPLVGEGDDDTSIDDDTVSDDDTADDDTIDDDAVDDDSDDDVDDDSDDDADDDSDDDAGDDDDATVPPPADDDDDSGHGGCW